mmetsp:Transcript_13958/g.40856  ORF Transcript_13958/g.40856 Transcript_13958/m.40856 type:complete len:98 (+) Transcript_13958:144-437(+)
MPTLAKSYCLQISVATQTQEFFHPMEARFDYDCRPTAFAAAPTTALFCSILHHARSALPLYLAPNRKSSLKRKHDDLVVPPPDPRLALIVRIQNQLR